MKSLLFLFFLIINTFCFAQQNQQEIQNTITDSLLKLPYKELRVNYKKYEYTDINKASIYAEAYIKKGKLKKDSIKIAIGYSYLAYLLEDRDSKIKYADSIILVTKNSTHKGFPTEGYLIKGYYYHEWGDYQKALTNFLDAYPISVRKNNIEEQLYIQNFIAILKDRWGNYEEALVVYKDMLKKIKQFSNYKIDRKEMYLNGLFNISASQIKNKKLDSALITIKKGIKESLIHKDSIFYHNFVYLSGVRNYHLPSLYNEALDSINKALPYIDVETDRATANYYKGRILYNQGLKEKAIINFLKSDSIFKITKDEFPELADNYQLLTNFYKEKKDLKKQLHYLEKLLYVDSLLDANYIDINRVMVKRYDIPLLIKDKDDLIKTLNNNTKTSYQYIYILLTIVVLTLFIIAYLNNRNRIYRARFNTLIEETNKTPTVVLNEVETKTDSLNISKEIIEQVLYKLELFESNEGYLKQDLTVQKLAKKFKTNSNYLSKIINTYKGKSFSNYTNELRINYTVMKLKNDINFRKYTVEAIAKEVGFNKAQSFGTAFSKITGLKPSYFIENLNKQQVD